MRESARLREAGAGPDMAGLEVTTALFADLDAAGIRYCHWKSNEHLGPALEGLTDLDVLVDPRQQRALQEILAARNYKRFDAVGSKRYPAVEDHFGFDPATGRIAHLHLHYRLTLGQPHLKGYRLPWERRVLETRIFDAGHGIHVAAPEMEMLLLLTRRVLKRRFRDRFRRPRPAGAPPTDFRREFDWLRARVSPETLAPLARDLLGPEAEAPLRALLDDPEDPAARRAFARAAQARLRHFRTYGPIRSALLAALREAQWIGDALNRRLFHSPTPMRRISPRGGVVIVLLGSDGSGKSSLARELSDWLGVKFDVTRIYFGSGQGPASLYRQPLRLARHLVERIAPPSPARPDAADRRSPAEGRGALRAIGLLPWALTLSLEKRAKLRRMIQARNRGQIVLCDRFAQGEFPGFNDGALLGHLRESRWGLARALAAWEEVPYRRGAVDPPDLVLKLFAPADVIATRRPEMTLPQIQRRLDTVRALSFPGSETVREVRTDGSLEETALAIKCHVWELL
ncbi:hypothetical protein [Amaricoccus solimangrovi]|uniref:Thymidylate kinase-like domain-containing protein n=1 Tax=Amaricoccus solimangrovi TaxID=2589815 RepID=A0A501WHZ1_9RHOB|nr:hypothetical protein [Amaricoccus solimangrovi]TPE49139.1 hypothetical protein FJM51_15825 [Amaricoccus solimangrovi]